jgi:hypothetical protein
MAEFKSNPRRIQMEPENAKMVVATSIASGV